MEFIDYECPVCRAFNETLTRAVSSVEKEYPGQVATVFIHFPLPMHRFANVAGQAVECASAQGRFSEMQALLFAKQDSFGLKPWPDYARDAGLPDVDRFAACLKDSSATHDVALGKALAEKLKLPGTPTVLINGWEFRGVPTSDELESAMRRVLRGESAVDSSQAFVANRPST